jgi:hypothetical protein
VHHIIVVDSAGHLRQQHMVLHVVEVGSQVDVDDARLAMDDGILEQAYGAGSRAGYP